MLALRYSRSASARSTRIVRTKLQSRKNSQTTSIRFLTGRCGVGLSLSQQSPIAPLMSPDTRDYRLATMLRLDPERLAALRRARTGKTKCPNCDETNDADKRFCAKCGAALYPDLEAERWDEEQEEAKD